MELFKIDGVDFTDILDENSVRWARNDLDASGSGRSNIDGTMQRKRVATKRKLSFTGRRMNQERAQQLCDALDKEYVTLYFPDPQHGMSTKTFYGSTVEAGLFQVRDGVAYWDSVTFNLIEK